MTCCRKVQGHVSRLSTASEDGPGANSRPELLGNTWLSQWARGDMRTVTKGIAADGARGDSWPRHCYRVTAEVLAAEGDRALT